jgi:hypothetical protein
MRQETDVQKPVGGQESADRPVHWHARSGIHA